MSFTLLPAVDVADGVAVRPVRGELAASAAGIDPLAAALRWQDEGADWLHLVDLDAAFGRGSNADLLASMVEELDVHTELSGGIADEASLQQALRSGCDRVVLATQALTDMEWCTASITRHTDRIAVALDVRIDERGDGAMRHRLAARGQEPADGHHHDLWATLELLDRAGCTRYVVTDVTRDGMLTGPNLELYRAVTGATPARLIASGGISSIADLVALSELAEVAPNLEGAIVGKALYADRFTLPEALAAVRPQIER